MSKELELQALRGHYEVKRAFKKLKAEATQYVSGAGNLNAELMFVGEAPGAQEDILGMPFVGRAGQVLSELLLSIGLAKDEVWITNLVKYRPVSPDGKSNRAPTMQEAYFSNLYLGIEVEIIDPKVIVPLGMYAMHALGVGGTISANRKKIFTVRNRTIVPLYHPSYAVRRPKMYSVLMNDFKVLETVLTP